MSIKKPAVFLDRDAVYYCPHYPDGIIEQYRKVCHCRKPKIGMVKQVRGDFNINMEDMVTSDYLFADLRNIFEIL